MRRRTVRVVRTSGALAVAMIGAGLLALSTGSAAPAAESTDWPAYERNAGHTSAAFADTAVTAANAGSLRRAWRFTAAAASGGAPGRGFDASPTVVGDRVYIGSRNGTFYALDATTGALVWKRALGFGANRYCTAKGIVATATVQADPVDGTLTVYAAGAHHLYALDAATGQQRWRRAIGPATAEGNALYFNWSSPTVSGGRVLMGLAANCDARKIRGGVVSVDQHTGALRATYYAIPAGKVGASVWSSQAADTTDVWVSTGNPDDVGTSIDDAYSIVRLDPSTLAKREKWTAPNAQASDLDFGSSPTLFTGTVGGVDTKLLGACNKNGTFYAWRQTGLAAGPVWSRTVGASGSPPTGACLTSAAWDFQARALFVAANQTTIAGTVAPGGLRRLDPSTGAVQWETALPCLPNGSPTINSQVVAVPLYTCPAGVSPSVRLYAKTSGAQVGTLPATGRIFAQPVFAAGKVFVADGGGALTAYTP